MDGLEALDFLTARLTGLRTAMKPILKKSFEYIKPAVEDKVIEQLARGEKGDGSNLPNYSIVSVTKFGKSPGPMILRDQGDFWRGITLVVDDDGVEIVGNDQKSEMLQLRYGDDIIELQEESKEEIVRDDLQPVTEEELKTYFEL